jgi:hypothetical protein
MRKDIHLPHLNYTIRVRDLKPNPDGGAPAAWMDRSHKDHSTLYLPKRPDPCLVAHELVHVLQHLYKVRNMGFGLESEHGAYIMQYAMGRILGYVWSKRA